MQVSTPKGLEMSKNKLEPEHNWDELQRFPEMTGRGSGSEEELSACMRGTSVISGEYKFQNVTIFVPKDWKLKNTAYPKS